MSDLSDQLQRTTCLQLYLAAVLIAFAPALGAQKTTASVGPAASKTGKAQIVGVVVDSLD